MKKPGAKLRLPAIYGLLALGLAASLVIAVGMGAIFIPPLKVLSALFTPASAADADPFTIIVRLRVIRAMLAAVVGASLATSGAVLQGLFRNPLADPYVIGSSSGAAFGAVCAIALGLEVSFLGFSAIGTAAFAGGMLATLIVYLVSGTSRTRSEASTLLLAGTALGSLFSALVSVMLALKDKDLHRAFFWMLGGFSGRGINDLLSALPAIVIGFAVPLASSRVLDVLSSGDETALSLGLRPGRARLALGLVTALSVSASVAISGAIGFVGLVCPHLARRFVGPAHRKLIPASALLGATLLMLSDAAARTLFAPVEMPVGAITALIGAPFFLYKISRRGLGKL